MNAVNEVENDVNTAQVMSSYSAAIGLLTGILRENPHATVEDIQAKFREEYDRLRVSLKMFRQAGFRLPETDGDQVDLLRALFSRRSDGQQIVAAMTVAVDRTSADSSETVDAPSKGGAESPAMLVAIARIQQIVYTLPMNQDKVMAVEYLANSVCEVAKVINGAQWRRFIRYAGDLIVEAYIAAVIFKSNLHGDLANRRSVEKMLDGFRNLTSIIDFGRTSEVAELNRALPDFILDASRQIVDTYELSSEVQKSALQYPICKFMADKAVRAWQRISEEAGQTYINVMDDPVELRRWFMRNASKGAGGIDLRALLENELSDLRGFGAHIDIDLQAVEEYATERAKLVVAAQAAISNDFQ